MGLALIELILGGARSGKSSLAEEQIARLNKAPFYLATATSGDEEMQARIDRHQHDRAGQGLNWQTIEEPLYLAQAIKSIAAPGRCILVDCLTLWLTNCLLNEDSQLWHKQRAALLALLPELACDIILVSNEVGYGIVPLGQLNRQFVDEAGRLHQAVAAMADSVKIVFAGCPVQLK